MNSVLAAVSVPHKLRHAVLPLWRSELIEVWYRQDREASPGRRTQFISITVDGQRRINALLSAQPSSSRASGQQLSSQGQSNAHDAASEPQQAKE